MFCSLSWLEDTARLQVMGEGGEEEEAPERAQSSWAANKYRRNVIDE